MTLAFATGPGGPIQAILSTQSIYQVIMDVFIAKQPIGVFGIIAVVIGLIGTISLSVGNKLVRKVMTEDQILRSPLQRFL